MKQTPRQYVVSFQVERFHQHTRYHWMICGAQNPDELVSWGHALSQDVAETAAQKEVDDLSSGVTHGGRVSSPSKTFIRR